MRQTLANMISRLAGIVRPKAIPPSLGGGQWTGTHYTDAYKRNRVPTPNELMAELKGTAWACASLNAAMCASYPPRLYVATHPGQAEARCLKKNITPQQRDYLAARNDLPTYQTGAAKIEEVLDHPLLTLLQRCNPVHNGFDLWELTQLYLEVHGRCFWKLDIDHVLGIPTAIWMLPAQNVQPRRRAGSTNIIDYFEYQAGATREEFSPAEVIFFRFPDPKDPYLGGLSPLRACFEQVALLSEYAATKSAIYQNRATPDALITPAEVIGEEERDRLESQINAKFRRGGRGRIMIAESPMKLQIIEQAMGDLKQLAEAGATKEDVCNAFHVPISYMTRETNLANLQAGNQQHAAQALKPRLTRPDEKLNADLVPRYDPTGRLFIASEDPVPLNFDNNLKALELNLKYGVISINEKREGDGVPPAPWGNVPWLPQHWWPTDVQRSG